MSERNPWTVLTSTQVYDNPWISVTEYDVLNPSGGPGIYGKVHFKNLAIGVLPLDDEMNTYLVGQFRFPIDRYSWEIPEGGGAEDVSPLESAQRELAEETGLTADRWTMLLDMHLSNSVTDERAHIFLARGLKQGQASPEETEQLNIRKLPFSELVDMVERGEVTDSITVAATLKVQLLIANGRIS